jgi:hypothetical protein
MNIERVSRLLLACSILALWTLEAGPLSGQHGGWPLGNAWLKWNHSEREKFVWGYTTAYSKGYGSACRQIALEWTGPVQPGYENAPLNKCLKGQLDFSKGSDTLIKSITDFYKRYPDDKDVSIEEILDLLGKGLSVEEVHNHPFEGHSSLSAKP